MHTRASFEQHRDRALAIGHALTRLLSVLAVSLGAGQLVLIKLAADRIAAGKKPIFAVALFAAYICVLAFLWWQRGRQIAAASPRCPKCQVAIVPSASAAVIASGRCPSCSAQVIQG